MKFIWYFQCSREGWKDKLDAQKNEGCEVHGYLEVTKVYTAVIKFRTFQNIVLLSILS
jgi:hypothetical protein